MRHCERLSQIDCAVVGMPCEKKNGAQERSVRFQRMEIPPKHFIWWEWTTEQMPWSVMSYGIIRHHAEHTRIFIRLYVCVLRNCIFSAEPSTIIDKYIPSNVVLVLFFSLFLSFGKIKINVQTHFINSIQPNVFFAISTRICCDSTDVSHDKCTCTHHLNYYFGIGFHCCRIATTRPTEYNQLEN